MRTMWTAEKAEKIKKRINLMSVMKSGPCAARRQDEREKRDMRARCLAHRTTSQSRAQGYLQKDAWFNHEGEEVAKS
jgi:hypothetical protein